MPVEHAKRKYALPIIPIGIGFASLKKDDPLLDLLLTICSVIKSRKAALSAREPKELAQDTAL